MSVELLSPIAEPEVWEVEEPRRRIFSPVEQDFMARHGLAAGPTGWTCDQYYRLADLGVLGPEERVELVDGEILQMSPQKSYHASGIQRVSAVLRKLFEPGCDLRSQLPLRGSYKDEPEPDVAVVDGTFDDYEEEHPTTARLVVEVSDTTRRFDLGTKAHLYASIGVPDYWVCDFKKLELVVHREPAPATGVEYGHSYRNVRVYSLDEEVEPLGAPGQWVRVRDLMPKALVEKKKQ